MSLKSLNIDKSWTLFLDRDGVINRQIKGDYVRSVNQLEILAGVPEAISLLTKKFNRIIVVTNQQGIGKGLMTEENLAQIHHAISFEVSKKGGNIDAFFYAPQLAIESSPYRKPGTAMADLAKTKFPEIDFQKSIMVGDSESDIQFGNKMNMITVYLHKNTHRTVDLANYSFADLTDFVEALTLK